MRKLALATVLAGALLLGLVALDLDVDTGAASATPAESPKLFYVLEPGRTLSLAVEPDTERVKLVCLAQLPLDDPLRDGYDLGFTAVLVDDAGDEVWQTPVWLHTRRTVAQGPDGNDRAYLVAEDALLTDERVLELDLGPLGGMGGELRLDPLADAEHPILVRPYRRMPLETQARAYRLQTLEEWRRQLMSRRIGASTWHEIDPGEQDRLSSFRWYRMEARGARVRDYATRLVVLSDYRGEGAEERARWHFLDPGRAVALNLRGPARVQLEVRPIDEDPRPADVSLVTVSQAGAIAVEPLPLDAGGRGDHAVEAPPGEVITLSVVNTGGAPVRVSATTADVPLGVFAGTSASFDRETGQYRLGPDIRILRMHRLRSDEASLEYELRPHPSGLDRVRVEARTTGDRAVQIVAELVDDGGRVLQRDTIACPAQPSFYEVAGTLEPGAMPTAAGQPTRFELWVGDGARRLRLSADGVADVAVSVPMTDSWEPAVADEVYQLDTHGVALRYAPLVDRTWIPFNPADLEGLAAAGREVCVSAQVRLEPSDAALVDDLALNPLHWAPAATTRRSGVAWNPEGTVARQRLLERWSTGRGRAGWWPEGAWTRLRAGEEMGLLLGQDGRDELRLSMWLSDPQTMGTGASLRLDDAEISRFSLVAEQMDLRAGPLPVGDHRVVLDVQDPDVLALVDRPPSGSAGSRELYRARTVFDLPADTPLRVVLPVPEDAGARLYFIPYYEVDAERSWPTSTASYTVDVGGERDLCAPFGRTTPLRIEGTVQAQGRAWGFLADRRSQTLVAAEPIRVPIGDDLEGGPVEVTLTRSGGGDRVWVRLVAYGVPAQARPEGAQWVEVARLATGDEP